MKECEVCFQQIDTQNDEYVIEHVTIVNHDGRETIERFYCDCLCLMMANTMRFEGTMRDVPGVQFHAARKNEMGMTLIKFRKEMDNHVYDQDS